MVFHLTECCNPEQAVSFRFLSAYKVILELSKFGKFMYEGCTWINMFVNQSDFRVRFSGGCWGFNNSFQAIIVLDLEVSKRLGLGLSFF